MIQRPQIAVVLGDGRRQPLGPFWLIEATESDFYLKPRGPAFSGLHLSVHGPNDRFDGHRFHVKIDAAKAERAVSRGHFVVHDVPHHGASFGGQQVRKGVFRVARLRWLSSMQNPDYRNAAASKGVVPDLSDRRTGAILNGELRSGSVWDLDVFVSFDGPYEPDLTNFKRTGNPILGPIRNKAGMHLTATSHHRSELKMPTPDSLLYSEPEFSEVPTAFYGGGPYEDVFWFVHSIVSEDFIHRSASALGHEG